MANSTKPVADSNPSPSGPKLTVANGTETYFWNSRMLVAVEKRGL